MRDYAQVVPRFWIGETGRKIRAAGRDCQIIALYLLTCPSSNMIGLYYLPMTTLCHETGMDSEGACKALARVCELGFAQYSDKEEAVFVPEMARYQIGENLKVKDRRRVGVARELVNFRKSCFFKLFMDRYAIPYRLAIPIRDAMKNVSPFEGGNSSCAQEQEQEQEQEQDSIDNPPAEKISEVSKFIIAHEALRAWELNHKSRDKIAACLKAYGWDEYSAAIKIAVAEGITHNGLLSYAETTAANAKAKKAKSQPVYKSNTQRVSLGKT